MGGWNRRGIASIDLKMHTLLIFVHTSLKNIKIFWAGNILSNDPVEPQFLLSSRQLLQS